MPTILPVYEQILPQVERVQFDVHIPPEPEEIGLFHPDNFRPLQRFYTIYFKDGSKYQSTAFDPGPIRIRHERELIEWCVRHMLHCITAPEKVG